MANEAFHLDWRGPFAIVDGAADPNLFVAKPGESRLPGVYVWTICGVFGRFRRGTRIQAQPIC
jgi:hypothetical protein